MEFQKSIINYRFSTFQGHVYVLATHSAVMAMTVLEVAMTAPATSSATLCPVAVTTLQSLAPVMVHYYHVLLL